MQTSVATTTAAISTHHRHHHLRPPPPAIYIAGPTWMRDSGFESDLVPAVVREGAADSLQAGVLCGQVCHLLRILQQDGPLGVHQHGVYIDV
jgi:hypothetical protein